LAEEFRQDGLRVLVVISEDPVRSPAGEAYCAQVREKNGLGAMAVCDPEDGMAVYGANSFTLLAGAGGVIVERLDGPTAEALRVTIAKLLPTL
jgi:hypothetical protein